MIRALSFDALTRRGRRVNKKGRLMKEPAYLTERATEPGGEPCSSGAVLTREARRWLTTSLIRLIQSWALNKSHVI
jgi:hypothetical protein